MELKEKFRVIIAVPARLESKRLPNKVLKNINGKTMIQRVLEQCKKNKFSKKIVLCTDSDLLINEANKLAIYSIKTSSKCVSGCDRISTVIDDLVRIAWDKKNEDYLEEQSFKFKRTLIINVQGDQPYLDPTVIDKMIKFFSDQEKFPEVITPIYKLKSENLQNPAVVKTLVNGKGKVIYFSRSVIPHVRDKEFNEWHTYNDYWGHVGIYGFRADILSRWNQLPESNLEKLEKLEQLRIIDADIPISTFEVQGSFLSVDTIAQLEEARKMG